MIPLLRTLFDISLLRRGPEHLPRSLILFGLTVVLWLFASLASLVLIPQSDEFDFFQTLFSAFIGLLIYAGIVYLSGFPARMLQTISAMLGVGALITLVFAAAYALLMPLAGEGITGLTVWLIICWSVAVEGHIIARAIDRHWYIGILIAMGVFSFQFALNVGFTTSS